MTKTTTTPQLYCGTYAKYNNGSIAGEWIDLTQFSSAQEFLQYCAELHKDEEDPEFMFQDYEGFPKCFYSESANSSDLEKLFDFINMDEHDRKLVEMYAEATGYSLDDISLDDVQDKYMGTADDGAQFAERQAEDCGDIPKDFPTWISNAIDWQAAWDRSLCYDYNTAKDEDGTVYFFLNH